MTFPPSERGVAVPGNGRDRSDGQPATAYSDPAHSGPLPRATLPELVGRLINDFSDLADRQIELAKQEIGEAKDEAIGATIRIAIVVGMVRLAARRTGAVGGCMVRVAAIHLAWLQSSQGDLAASAADPRNAQGEPRMGETPEDTEREIVHLRSDMSAAMEE